MPSDTMVLEKNSLNGKIWFKVFRISEFFSLFTVMCYCLFRYLETTTFSFTFLKDQRFHVMLFSMTVAAGVIRFILCLLNEKGTLKKRIVLVSVLSSIALCLILSQNRGYAAPSYSFLIYLPFAALCLCGIEIEKVLKAFAISMGVLLLATILCALSGSIENILYPSAFYGKMRGSYGIAYPTDFAAYFIFLFLFCWCSGKVNSIPRSVFFSILILIILTVNYLYISSRTSLFAGILCLIAVLFELLYNTWKDKKVIRQIRRITDGITIGIFPVSGLLFGFLTWLYGQKSELAIQLNQFFSGRLKLTWDHYLKYGIQAFGAVTPQAGGGGGLIQEGTYEFLDSSYALLLIRYGWIFAIVVTCLWIWITRKALKTGHRRIATAMAIVAIASFSEHHFPELNFNILLAIPLCAFPLPQPDHRKEKSQCDQLIPWLTGAAVAGGMILLLPKALSISRTLFEIKGWSGGELKSIPALLFWLIVLTGLFLLWHGVTRFFLYRKSKQKNVVRTIIEGLAGILCILGLFCFSAIEIQGNLTQFDKQYLAEQEKVQMVLDAAKEPVYAAKEELYKQHYNGISDRIFTEPELGRSMTGSIIMDHDEEGFLLMKTGARYWELSEYSGLFTYDDAVVEALQKAGYFPHGYFSAEQKVDLLSLAEINNLELTEKGTLFLEGTEHSILNGPNLAQFSDQYQVTFDLQLPDAFFATEQQDKEICRLRVTTQRGQSIRAEKTVIGKDFCATNPISVSLEYSLNTNSDVEFVIACNDSITLEVSQIAWKRNPKVDTWRIYTSEGRVKKELYYTSDGIPLIQGSGYYGQVFEYNNGNELWTTCGFLDRDGKTLIAIPGGYSQIQRKLDHLKRVTELRYLDENGNPCLCTDNYSGYRQEYDIHNNILQTAYFGTQNQLINRTTGYAIVQYTYDESDNRISECYLDSEKKPVLRTDTLYAGKRMLYDDNKHLIGERYYDTEGKLTISSTGIAGIDRSLNERYQTVSEQYIGTDGKPMTSVTGYTAFQRILNDDGNVMAEAYLNTNNKLTVRNTGYAVVSRTYNRKRLLERESYQDPEGNLVALADGYAGFAREYDENNNIIAERYLDNQGNETIRNQGYSCIRREYNAQRKLIKESYFAYDAPFIRNEGYASFEREYDERGNLILEQYLDPKGNRVSCTSGYAILRREYNSKNQLIRESYYDSEDQPICRSSNQASLTRKYDTLGNVISEAYYDAEGKPTILTNGYDEIRREYNEKKQLTRESYYADGQPVNRMDTWFASFTRNYDDRGNIIAEAYQDKEGHPIFRNGGYASLQRTYNDFRQITGEYYFDENGSSFLLPAGYAGLKREYDTVGNLISEKYLDKDGDPILRKEGFAELKRAYNTLRQITEESYYNGAGKLIARSDNHITTKRNLYDFKNRFIGERYYDPDGNPILSSSGHAGYDRELDSQGRILSERYVGTDGMPQMLAAGYAAYQREYDPIGNILSESYCDDQNNLTNRNTGYAAIRREYDDKRQKIYETYLDKDGQRAVLPDGYTSISYEYDAKGNASEICYMDADDVETAISQGYSSIQREYDSRRKVKTENYFLYNKPIILKAGYAAIEREYDDRGNTIFEKYLDDDKNAVSNTDGYASLHRTYNSLNQLLTESYYDPENNLVNIGISKYAEFRNEYDQEGKLSLTYYYDNKGNQIKAGSVYFHEYLQDLTNRKATIFMSIRDEGTNALTDTLMDDLHNLGIQSDLRGKYRNSFYAIISPNNLIEEVGSEALKQEGEISEEKIKYIIQSAGYLVGNFSSIVINGEEYSKNVRGINIVIVEDGNVTESIAFDTHAQEMSTTQ